MNTYLINIETMQFPIYESELRAQNPGISYPSPLTNPPEPYAWVLVKQPPSFDLMTQELKEVAPKNVDGIWYQDWEISPLSDEQIAINEDGFRKTVKSKAMQLLQQTDWVEYPSVSNTNITPHLINYDEFMSYRIALRSIAVNPPVTVETWPTIPSEQWSQ